MKDKIVTSVYKLELERQTSKTFIVQSKIRYNIKKLAKIYLINLILTCVILLIAGISFFIQSYNVGYYILCFPILFLINSYMLIDSIKSHKKRLADYSKSVENAIQSREIQLIVYLNTFYGNLYNVKFTNAKSEI